ncbi:MAG: hypothetical protein WC069_06950 [Candidatus Shapirobacteria bacterium]|jgi:hypothetical protein
MSEFVDTFATEFSYATTKFGVLTLPELAAVGNEIRERRMMRMKAVGQQLQVAGKEMVEALREVVFPEVDFATIHSYADTPNGAQSIIERAMKKIDSTADASKFRESPEICALLARIACGFVPAHVLYRDPPKVDTENPPQAVQEPQ